MRNKPSWVYVAKGNEWNSERSTEERRLQERRKAIGKMNSKVKSTRLNGVYIWAPGKIVDETVNHRPLPQTQCGDRGLTHA